MLLRFARERFWRFVVKMFSDKSIERAPCNATFASDCELAFTVVLG